MEILAWDELEVIQAIGLRASGGIENSGALTSQMSVNENPDPLSFTRQSVSGVNLVSVILHSRHTQANARLEKVIVLKKG